MENERMAKNSKLVYSSDQGRIGDTKKAAATAISGDGIARVRREKKGRGGKTVTTVSGLLLKDAELKELASALKRLCGAGGSVKHGIIEIQGDNADKVVDTLEKLGHKAKRAGG
ncbi:MAG: translation initiation factor 1 [Candidatus Latescibacterota bacterium]|jgi:translation initiation factor 1